MTDETNVTPLFVSLGEAAKRTGLSKTTIHRKIRSGQLSVRERGEDGTFRIDVSELMRFMDASRVTRASRSDETDETPPVSPREQLIEERAARQFAEAKVAMAEERLAELKGILEELRGDRDQWREQAQRLALPATRSHRRWWWRAG